MGLKFVSTGDVAYECGVTKSTVLKWIEKGYLKAVKLPSGHHRILKEEFDKFKKSLWK